ncbi:XRE family transcriptional regulator [Sporosarcina sp. P37]|uniref:LexA family protein n=1 Tax=unclassified Sporosarcina TaxID=2647733 RepID=UPI000A179BAE|nr:MULTISPECIES: XRE family transcriptional regulator [unclassified Sporosarcina]ARK23605.1 XRE family transcriptional regulator [Sporosarcina sp. P37]
MKDIESVIAQNIKKLLNEYNLNQNELAKIAGVSESTVGKWVLRKSTPRMGAVQKIVDHFGIPKSYILEEKPTNLIEVSQRTIRIPVLGKIACGDPILAEENYEDYRTVLEEGLPSGNLVYLEAKGDSMQPTIPNGAMVMIREQPEVEYGEIAAVLVNGNEEVTLKRIKKQGGVIFLMPDNPAHEPILVDEDNPIKIIGKAVKFEQDL